MLHADPKNANVGWSSPRLKLSAENRLAFANSTGIVNKSFGSQQTVGRSPTVGADQIASLGVWMDPPQEDTVPYRIKAHFQASENVFIVFGYARNGVTGSDDLVARYILLPFDKEFDEVLALPKLDSSDEYYQKPVYFGLCTGLLSNTYAEGHISVQKLSEPSRQYSASMS